MNDRPLSPSHGFPVRLLAPGIAGARSVKWLDMITIQLTESPNYYQQKDYKVLPPQATSREIAEKYWPLCPAVQGMPVNSVICVPATGETVVLPSAGRGLVEVKGYAVPSDDQGPVTKVEVSTDDGKTWIPATFLYESENAQAGKWAWTLWRAEVSLTPGDGRRIVSRAVDSGGNVQPEMAEWNYRGVVYNGWGEARELKVVAAEGNEYVNGLENGNANEHENGVTNGRHENTIENRH
jgi:sulfite oxidase